VMQTIAFLARFSLTILRWLAIMMGEKGVRV
jgi:hypothetical protein